MKTFSVVAGTLALWSVVPSVPVGEAPAPVVAARFAKSATLAVDPSRSTLNWTAKKVGGEHSGTVNISSGTLEVKPTPLRSRPW